MAPRCPWYKPSLNCPSPKPPAVPLGVSPPSLPRPPCHLHCADSYTHPSSHLPQTPPPPRSLPGPLGPQSSGFTTFCPTGCEGRGQVAHRNCLSLPLFMALCVWPQGGGSVAFLHTDAHPSRIFSLAIRQGQALARHPCPQVSPVGSL